MEERLDRLFKHKLGNYKVTPTKDAWEQINDQLAHRKKNKWTKRLGIAATLLLLISASFIGYDYLNGIERNTPLVSKSADPKTNENSASQNILQNDKSEQFVAGEEETESLEKNNEAKVDIVPSKTMTAEITKARGQEETLVNIEELPESNSQENLIPVSEPPVLQESELLAESTEPEIDQNKKEAIEEKLMLVEATPQTQKSYPKVRIVYKADANSDLVVSNNRNLLDKGIKKITKFSDEHIVTDQVKTKLRNTKDDLLALNFGKLINKPNRDIDN
jgi:hypothetical protein